MSEFNKSLHIQNNFLTIHGGTPPNVTLSCLGNEENAKWRGCRYQIRVPTVPRYQQVFEKEKRQNIHTYCFHNYSSQQHKLNKAISDLALKNNAY